MHRIIKLCILSAFSLAMIIAQTGCGGGGAEPVSADDYMLDTICSISIYAFRDDSGKIVPANDDKEHADRVIKEAFDLCRSLEDKLSRTREDSDIGRINAAGGEWTEVSEETLELIQKGLEYSKLSEGAFDISCGGITELWDFHAAEGQEKLPDKAELEEACKHIDFEQVEIDGSKVRLKDPEAKMDLGGIAKGYIGDRMTELLEDEGVYSAIINLGGNVICIGSKPDGDPFVIGVEAPFSDRTEIIGKIESDDNTLVTSGVYERKLEIDGKIYHHILNTDTGFPVETDLNAVTLVAEKGHSADADALSTICLLKGADEAERLIAETDGVEAVFVLKNGEIATSKDGFFEEEK